MIANLKMQKFKIAGPNIWRKEFRKFFHLNETRLSKFHEIADCEFQVGNYELQMQSVASRSHSNTKKNLA